MKTYKQEVLLPLNQALSDDEIRAYDLYIDRPEIDPRYTRDLPLAGVEFVQFTKVYDIPHTKGSRRGLAWCCYCQRNSHFLGALGMFSDGRTRSVGWCCCKTQLDENIRKGFKALKEQRLRASHLVQFDEIARVLPDLLREIDDLQNAPSVIQFGKLRAESRKNLNPLWLFVSDIAFNDDGWVEQHVILKRTAAQQDQEKQKSRGHVVNHRIGGYRFVHPIQDLKWSFNKIRAQLGPLIRFYSQSKTDHIKPQAFNSYLASARNLLERLNELQQISASLPDFFAYANLKMLVEIRNDKLAEPAYRATRSGLIWRPLDEDEKTLQLPKNYHPLRIRNLGRLSRAVKKL